MQTLLNNIWRPNEDRVTMNKSFKPQFERFIGVTADFANSMATLKDCIKTYPNKTVFFENSIPMQVTPELSRIQALIKDELKTLDLNRTTFVTLTDATGQPFIKLFTNDKVNVTFLAALDTVMDLANQHETFPNTSVQINFVAKLITWAYLYIKDMVFTPYMVTKCVYYGTIKTHEYYFLILLYAMHFDVIYINPNQLVDFPFDTVSTLHQSPLDTTSTKSFDNYAKDGTAIHRVDSVLQNFDTELEDSLYSEDSGNYRPWQFKKGTTKSVLYNATLLELKNNWNEQATYRAGFSITNKVVSVPHFFFEIEGCYDNIRDYADLINLTRQSKLTYVCTSTDPLIDIHQFGKRDVLSLAFTKDDSGKFDRKMIQEHALYPYAHYNDDTETFMVDKMIELLENKTILAQAISSESDKLCILAYLLNLPKGIIQLIDSFDYTKDIPKFVLFCNPDEPIRIDHAALMAYLTLIGFDIIVYSPSGQTGLSTFIDPHYTTSTRLDKVDYQLSYRDTLLPTFGRAKKAAGGLFAKLKGVL